MIIAFTSLHPGGVTFLDWSFHYLKGNDHFWYQEKGLIPLTPDPLQDTNAHTHVKNHPRQFHLWHEFLEIAKKESMNIQNDITFYPCRYHIDKPTEWVENINQLVSKGAKVVIIKKTMEYPYADERTTTTYQQAIESFLNENPEVDKETSNNKLRDLCSLRIIAHQKAWLEAIDSAFASLDEQVIVVNDTEYINDTENCVKMIFSRLDSQIDPNRLNKWRPIQIKWNQTYWAGLQLDTDLPKIIDGIVDGTDLDLAKYNIGFFQESLIMAHLMKDKARRLILPSDYFPKNTKELHKFLQ